VAGRLRFVRARPQKHEMTVTAPAEDSGPLIVTKLMFAPVKIVAKRVAPRLSRKLFTRLWSVVDDTAPPPRPQERQASVGKLLVALALEGACTAVVSGLLDQASRRKFARVTGRWPGRSVRSSTVGD